jgi:hypothetical protein
VIDLSEEQRRAYKRFIIARDKVGVVRTQGYSKRKWIRQADVVCTVDISGINHPLFEQNDDWLEYKEASLAWWAIEPEFRKIQRMSAIRGDYGSSDSWDEGGANMRDTFLTIQGDE